MCMFIMRHIQFSVRCERRIVSPKLRKDDSPDRPECNIRNKGINRPHLHPSNPHVACCPLPRHGPVQLHHNFLRPGQEARYLSRRKHFEQTSSPPRSASTTKSTNLADFNPRADRNVLATGIETGQTISGQDHHHHHW